MFKPNPWRSNEVRAAVACPEFLSLLSPRDPRLGQTDTYRQTHTHIETCFLTCVCMSLSPFPFLCTSHSHIPSGTHTYKHIHTQGCWFSSFDLSHTHTHTRWQIPKPATRAITHTNTLLPRQRETDTHTHTKWHSEGWSHACHASRPGQTPRSLTMAREKRGALYVCVRVCLVSSVESRTFTHSSNTHTHIDTPSST